MRILLFMICMLGGLNPLAADELEKRYPSFGLPAGAWLLTVEFPVVPGAPPPPPAFKETLTLHALGTVSESNTLLNENSYNPALGMGCGFTGPGGSLELNCNGSEGTGSWKRTGRKTVSFIVVKFVYDGVTNQHVGYLRVSSKRAVINGNKIKQDADFTLTEFLVGADIESAIAIPLGGANSSGIRIR
ncbi:MAG: hypothetical protein AAF438_09015 [Pseudomonadota bacterium]